MIKLLFTLLGVLSFFPTVFSEQHCSSEGICIAVNVPTAHIASGNPDLLFTLQAPSSSKWFATGFGGQMAGTLMLVAWPYNQQVIVSSRLAVGHALPPPYSGPQIQILSQNVTKDFTTVQLKCSNCTVWSKGKLDVQSTAANFIYAYGTTAPTNPSSNLSSFTQHAEHGNFQLNLKQAQNSSNAAPQISGQGKPANGGKSGGLSERQWIVIIHGVLMGLIWVILFPLGAVIIRFLGNVLSKAVGKHRIVQITTLLLLLGAGGVGIYLASGHHFSIFHHFFGAAIIGMAITQAIFGWYHHKRYVRDKPTKRRWFTHVHLWLGRTTILCGMANCGFGILAAGRPLSNAIIFWIVCGVLAAMYFGAYVIISLIRKRTGKHGGVAYSPAAPGAYSLNPYQGSTDNLLNQPGRSGGNVYAPPPGPPGGIPGRYEPDRYNERFQDSAPEPYDPPRRQFEDPPVQRYGSPVQRYGSPSGARQDLHLDK